MIAIPLKRLKIQACIEYRPPEFAVPINDGNRTLWFRPADCRAAESEGARGEGVVRARFPVPQAEVI